jgi:hypothetical protein
MDEDILAAVIGLDETEALLRIEPLHFSGSHSELNLHAWTDATSAVHKAARLGRELGKPAAPRGERERAADGPVSGAGPGMMGVFAQNYKQG